MKFYIILVTTPSRAASETLSKGLVEKRLAACVNCIPSVWSRYWWKGKIETAREELLLIKTRGDRLSKLIQWVKARHPYTVCEVIALPIARGNRAYFQWIDENIK